MVVPARGARGLTARNAAGVKGTRNPMHEKDVTERRTALRRSSAWSSQREARAASLPVMPPVMRPALAISVPSSATTLCRSGPMNARRRASATVWHTSVFLRARPSSSAALWWLWHHLSTQRLDLLPTVGRMSTRRHASNTTLRTSRSGVQDGGTAGARAAPRTAFYEDGRILM